MSRGFVHRLHWLHCLHWLYGLYGLYGLHGLHGLRRDLDDARLRVLPKQLGLHRDRIARLRLPSLHLSGVDAESQDLFLPGDEVTVCGIAAEYCVRETLINVAALAVKVGFKLSVYLPGTARFGSYDTLLETMKENGVTEYH